MRCICVFETCCDGSGIISCTGCGGDLCVCAACMSSGEAPCSGCTECHPLGDAMEGDEDDNPDRRECGA